MPKEVKTVDESASVEVDERTLELLKEEGMDVLLTEGTEAEPKDEVVGEETEEAPPQVEEPAEETPAEEIVEPEPKLIRGRFKTQADYDAAYDASERKIYEQGQQIGQLGQAQQILTQLSQTEEGQKALFRALNPQPVRPQIPTDDEAVANLLGAKPYDGLKTYHEHFNEPYVAKVNQLEAIVNNLLGYIEKQTAESQYGNLDEIGPFREKVVQELGQLAPYIPVSLQLRMAEGELAKEKLAKLSRDETTKQDKEAAKERHRAKAIDASVESAGDVARPEARVINFDKMDADEMRKKMIEGGIPVAERG